MKYFALAFALFSFNALACWKMKATAEVDGKMVLVDQKIDHDKIYSFPSGNLIFHVTIPSRKNIPKGMPELKKDSVLVELRLEEKKGTSLKEVAKGRMIVKEGEEAIMTKQDTHGGPLTKFKMTVHHI